MRKIISLFLSFLLMFSIIIPAQVNAAEEPIKVYINGELINFSIDPIVENGTTLVQLRPIFEKLGLELEWDSDNQSISGIRGSTGIYLELGNKIAKVNGISVLLNEPAKVIDGNTLVPLRFISESLGAIVEWDNSTRIININGDINSTTIYDHNLPIRIVGDEVTNVGNNNILSVSYFDFFYDQSTKQIVSDDDSIIGLDKGETEKIYLDNRHYDKIYLGRVVQQVKYYDDTIVKNSNYNTILNYYNSQEYINSINDYLSSSLKQELKNNNNIPLKITYQNVSYNSIGVPEANVTFKNLTTKTVDAFEIRITCYDNYNRLVRKAISGDKYFYGIAQQDVKIYAGKEQTFLWTMNLFDNATKIKVEIMSVHYTDGSVWKK